MAYVPIKIATNLSSAIVEQNGYLIPINTTENWTGHFDTRSWLTPQDQIDAGYPIFIQPAASSGYYEEVFDCEALLGNRQIVTGFTGSALASAITTTTDISVSTDNVTYTTYENVSTLIVSGFRYIKVRVNVNSNSTGLYLLTDLDIVLNEQFDQDVVPSRYNNSNLFYLANLNVGEVVVTPNLYTNANQFFEHDVIEGGIVLSPARYDNTNIFYDAQLILGGINLEPSLYENSNNFYDIVITNVATLLPVRFDNTNVFNTATISAYNVVSVELFNNENVIFSPTVIAEGVAQELTPQLFVNNNNFYIPSIQLSSRDSEFLGTFVRRRRTSKDIYNLPETPLKSKKRKTLEVLMMG